MFGKLWNKFVGPWEAYKFEREGWRIKYVFARKFFGKMQYAKSYGKNHETGFYKVHAFTFCIKNAYEFDEFDEFVNYEKSVLRSINTTNQKNCN